MLGKQSKNNLKYINNIIKIQYNNSEIRFIYINAIFEGNMKIEFTFSFFLKIFNFMGK